MNQLRDNRPNRKSMFSSNEHIYISPTFPPQRGYPGIDGPQNVNVGLNVEPGTAARFRCMSSQNPLIEIPGSVPFNMYNAVPTTTPLMMKAAPKRTPEIYRKHKDYACMQRQIMQGYAMRRNNSMQPISTVTYGEKKNPPLMEKNKVQLEIHQDNKSVSNVNSSNNPIPKVSINTTVTKPVTKTVPCLKYSGKNCSANLGWWNFQEKSQMCKNIEKYKQQIKERYEESRRMYNERPFTLHNNNSNKIFPNEYFYIPATDKNYFRSKSKSKIKTQPVSDFHKVNLKPITGFLHSYQKLKERVENPQPGFIKVSKHPLVIKEYPKVYKDNKRSAKCPFELGEAEIMMVDNEGENLNHTTGVFLSVNNNDTKNVQVSNANGDLLGSKGLMFKYKKPPRKKYGALKKNAGHTPKNFDIRVHHKGAKDKSNKKNMQQEETSSENSDITYDNETEYDSDSESNINGRRENVHIICRKPKKKENTVNMKKYKINFHDSREQLHSDVSSEVFGDEDEEEEEGEGEDENDYVDEDDDYAQESGDFDDDDDYNDDDDESENNYRGEYNSYAKEIQSCSSNGSENRNDSRYQLKDKEYSTKNCDVKLQTNVNKGYIGGRRRNSCFAISPQSHNRYYTSNEESKLEFRGEETPSIENFEYSNEEDYREKDDTIYEPQEREYISNGRYKYYGDGTLNDEIHREYNKRPTDLNLNNYKTRIKQRPLSVNTYENVKKKPLDTKYESDFNRYNVNYSHDEAEKRKKHANKKGLNSQDFRTNFDRLKNGGRRTGSIKQKRNPMKNPKERHRQYSDSGNSCVESYMEMKNYKNHSVPFYELSDSVEKYIKTQKSRGEPRTFKLKNNSGSCSYQYSMDGRKFKLNAETKGTHEKNRKWNSKNSKKSYDDYLEKQYDEAFICSD